MSNTKRDFEEQKDLEAQVFDAVRSLGWIIPQTKDEVKLAEQEDEFSQIELPGELRDPYLVFDKIVAAGNEHSVEDCPESPQEHGGGSQQQFRVVSNDANPNAKAIAGPEAPHVFGSFIQLLRRKNALSTEDLAQKARIDHGEILRIESDESYEPKPRTVHQLAEFFRLPPRPLLKLSNLTHAHNTQLTEAAVRFAAHAKSIMKLSREERGALDEFVKFLSSME